MSRIHHINLPNEAFPIPVINGIDNHCTACGKMYRNRPSYKLHLYSTHGIRLPRMTRNGLQVNYDTIPDMDDNRHCASCNKTYSSRAIYRCHLVIIHNMQKLEIKQEEAKETLNIRSVQTN